jgi:threonine/homoserine/homoserine lactone efflux protein
LTVTVFASDLGLYAVAILLLFLTPGPVWVALMARSLSGGFSAAWPLALGVTIGDALWPLLAIFGVGWIVSVYGGFLVALKWIACATFVIMGGLILRSAGQPITADSRLTQPGMWAGFVAGVAVIIGNPKAVLFYMGILPGFFDVGTLTAADTVLICAVSMSIPLVGNLAMAYFIGLMREALTSPKALRRTNQVAGSLLIVVGLVLPWT